MVDGKKCGNGFDYASSRVDSALNVSSEYLLEFRNDLPNVQCSQVDLIAQSRPRNRFDWISRRLKTVLILGI